MAPEVWCQTNATEFWCHSISGAKLPFADVTPLFEFGTTTPSALRIQHSLILMLTDEEPEHFGDDELPRPPGLQRLAKSQRLVP
ncbi:hypothetical protein Tco_0638589 [Tanacetum coccineum]